MRATSVSAWLALVLLVALSVGPVNAALGASDIVQGMRVGSGARGALVINPPSAVVQTVLPPPPGATVINFDNVSAPCAFLETVALTNLFASVGVTFSGGAGPNDGLAILNECSTFGVTGFSAPNFLAWNDIATLENGGKPIGPEVIHFSPPVSLVQINAGSAATFGLVTMEAFSAGGTSLGSTSVPLQSALQTLRITASGIARVVITFPPNSGGVLDDLAFVFSAGGGSANVPTLSEWGVIAMVGLLVGLAVLTIGRRLSRRGLA